MRYIDLHTHSYRSDGSMSPTELVKHAAENGLSAIALTDHDTTDGIEEALEAGKKYGVEIVAGIEFSARSEGETHILGFDININDPDLNNVVTNIKETRLGNNRRTAETLQKLGFDVTLDDVKKIAPHGIIGRAHFARVMADKGYVSSVKEAFDLYLQKGKPGYSSIRSISDTEAIRVIKNAGGKAYLAHLHLTQKSGQELDGFVKYLKNQGLDGIEGYYTDYTPEMQKEYMDLAEKYSLKISGGTDFHGNNKPHIKIGTGYGNLKIPYSILENIRK